MKTQSRAFRQRRWIECIIATALFVASGYFSNTVSLSAAEAYTASWLKARLAKSGTTWPGKTVSHQPAEFTFPWILRVKYEYVAGNLGGEWGTRVYLSLFGLTIPLHHHIDMQS
jgi:hypothetical protein